MRSRAWSAVVVADEVALPTYAARKPGNDALGAQTKQLRDGEGRSGPVGDGASADGPACCRSLTEVVSSCNPSHRKRANDLVKAPMMFVIDCEQRDDWT
jgi:hypothetical protein